MIAGIFLASCSKSDNTTTDIFVGIPPNDGRTGAFSYTSSVNRIMVRHCIGCHGSTPTNGARFPLTTYEEVRSAVENQELLERINGITKPMPPDELMPSDTRQIIEEWVNENFPR